MKTLGIDLGTTYSCMAYINDVGDAEVIPNLEGSNVTPSVVYFESSENVVVGETAKENTVLEPKATISLVKRLMGNSDFAIEYDGVSYSPAQISALILKKMAGDASRHLNEEVKDVVITCPAYFGTPERTATEAAGELAGLNVLAIINEPTAAAISYGLDKGGVDKTIVVYDLGGGTFDVTIIRIEEEDGKKVIRAIATGGDHQLGGQNWDRELMNYLEEQFREQNNFDDELEEDEALQFEQDLRLLAEKHKKQLTTMKKAKIPIVAAGMKARVELEREKFDELTQPLLERTIDEMNRTMEAAKAKGVETIDEIIMVGGSSRMPQVEEILNKNYPDIPKRMYDPDEAVAKGAAVFAQDMASVVYREDDVETGDGILSDPVSGGEGEDAGQEGNSSKARRIGGGSNGVPNTPTVTIINVTSKSFGVELVNDDGEPYVYNMIFRNQELPIDTSLPVITFADNQETVAIKVYESDISEQEYDVNEEFFLGEATLIFDKPMPKDSPVEIQIRFEADGILHLRGVDSTTGKDVKVDLQSSGIMTREEIQEQKAVIQGIRIVRD